MAEIKAKSDHDNRQPDGYRDRDQSTCSHPGSKRSSPSLPPSHRATALRQAQCPYRPWLGNKLSRLGCGS